MKIAFCAFVVLCLINVSIVSSLKTPYSCAHYKITSMQGFNKTRYLGDWFLQQLYDFEGQNDYPSSYGYECFVVIRTPRPDEGQNYLIIRPSTNNGLPEVKVAGVTYFHHPGEGRYTFSSEDIPEYAGEYVIIDTDYLTYTIETKCTDLTVGESEVELYVLIRAPTISILSTNKIAKVIADHHFDDNTIRKLNVLSCPSKFIGGGGLIAGLLKLVTTLVGGVLEVVSGIIG